MEEEEEEEEARRALMMEIPRPGVGEPLSSRPLVSSLTLVLC